MRRFIKITFGLLLVIVLLQAGHLYLLGSRLQTQLDAIRAQGHPTTGQELNSWYPYPQGKNAADIYAQAFEKYVEGRDLDPHIPGFGADWPEVGEPWQEEMLQATEEYLAKNNEAIGLLYEAGKIDECRYPVDLSLGIEALLPHLDSLQHGAKLLSLQAALAAQQGDGEQATDAVLEILNLSRSLKNEPLLLSRLMANVIVGFAAQAAKQVTRQIALQESQLDNLIEALVGTELEKSLTSAMVGERSTGIILYQNTDAFGFIQADDFGGLVITIIWKLSGLSYRDMIAYLNAMSYLIEKSQNMYETPPGIVDQTATNMVFTYGISGMLVPALGAVHDVQKAMHAAIQTIVVGFSVKQYQLAHGRWPERLDDLVPQYLAQIPIDPFDGQPLRFKKQETGFMVYSVGQDGIDNGGRIENEEGLKFKEGTDVVFSLPD